MDHINELSPITLPRLSNTGIDIRWFLISSSRGGIHEWSAWYWVWYSLFYIFHHLSVSSSYYVHPPLIAYENNQRTCIFYSIWSDNDIRAFYDEIYWSINSLTKQFMKPKIFKNFISLMQIYKMMLHVKFMNLRLGEPHQGRIPRDTREYKNLLSQKSFVWW